MDDVRHYLKVSQETKSQTADYRTTIVSNMDRTPTFKFDPTLKDIDDKKTDKLMNQIGSKLLPEEAFFYFTKTSYDGEGQTNFWIKVESNHAEVAKDLYLYDIIYWDKSKPNDMDEEEWEALRWKPLLNNGTFKTERN